MEDCRNILPKKVFDLWGKLLCEAAIPEADKFYCPFKNCSALMIDDGECRKLAKKFKCPHCDGMFCAQCKVAWHHGIRCKEFQGSNGDVMMMGLAKEKSWQSYTLRKMVGANPCFVGVERISVTYVELVFVPIINALVEVNRNDKLKYVFYSVNRFT
ncbi:hypothetical protein AHAS_Ahas19G0029400 [Arachis hypogaea]